MKAYQTPAKVYYLDVKRRALADTLAPDRPSEDHAWVNGTGWVVPADIVARRIAAKVDNAVARAPLLFELIYQETLQPPPMTRAQLRALLLTIQGGI